MPDKLQKLQKLMELANNSLSVEEFLANFKIVIEYVKKTEINLEKKIDNKCESAQNELDLITKQLKETDQEYQNTLKRIEEDSQSTLSNLKKWALERVGDLFIKSSVNQELKNKISEVDKKMELVKAYKLPTTSELVSEVSKIVEDLILPKIPKIPDAPKIPTIEELETNIPKLGAEIRNALELLQGDERLDVSAIKGLDELIKKVEKLSEAKQTTRFVGGGGGVGKHNTFYYDLSPYLDGTTKTFSLPAAWKVIGVHSGGSAPATFRPTVDFTWSPNSITFTAEIEASTTLAAGQTIMVVCLE